MLNIDIQLPRDHFLLNIKQSLDGDSMWAIMGRSGCGKTSLLRTIAGLERQAKGRIVFNDELWQDSAQRVWLRPEHRSIGYIFQDARLFPHLDVMENLQFARKRASSGCGPVFADLIERLGIGHLLNRNVDCLSGGEMQRVAIARTLLNAPRLLLMDEPLASLDWESKSHILPCLRDMRQQFGMLVVMVSHAREEVATLADKLLLMGQGQVQACGECRQLLSRPGSLLTKDDHALSVLDVQVSSHDHDYGYTELLLGQQRLQVRQISALPGTELRIVLSAQEVSIVVEDIDCTSVQNRVSATIQAVQAQSSNNVLLFLNAEGQTLLALVTRRAMGLLQLSPGMQVFAHFKASCLDVIEGA